MSISKKRQFVKKGIFFAEINEFLRRMLAEDGYAGVEVKPQPESTHIIIKCTKIPEVVKRIPYIQKLIQLRHKEFSTDESLKVFAEKVQARGLSARAQAQSICYKLKGGLAVRRACYGVLKFIMDDGEAKGVEIIISGKLRGARAKAMKFNEGYMVTSGDATNYYIREAVEHVLLRQGTIGVRVKIMLPYDPEGKKGTSYQLPDIVTVKTPVPDKDDDDDEPQAYGAPAGYEQPPVYQQQPAAGQFDQQQQQPQAPPQGYDQQGQGQFYQPPQQQQQPPAQYGQQNYVTPGGPPTEF